MHIPPTSAVSQMLPEFPNRLLNAIREKLNQPRELNFPQSDRSHTLSQNTFPIRLETILCYRVFTSGLSRLYTDTFNGGKDAKVYKKNCTDPNSVTNLGYS